MIMAVVAKKIITVISMAIWGIIGCISYEIRLAILLHDNDMVGE